MTDAFATPSETGQEVRRDRYGRYMLPTGLNAKGGVKDEPYTRVTTFKSSIEDNYGIAKWQQRNAVKGLTMRPDLFALAAATPIDDSRTLDTIAEAAKEAAGGSAKANLGTALHSFGESVDRGQMCVDDIPAPYDQDIEAYVLALHRAGIEIMPDLIERVVLSAELQTAGTFDRIVRMPDDSLRIADMKTGGLDYAWSGIEIQLAIYSRSAGLWDNVKDVIVKAPDVDQSLGLVFHVPAGEGVCNIYDVDLNAGWQGALLCKQVRDARKQKRKPVPHVPAVPGLPVTDWRHEILAATDRKGVLSVLNLAKARGAATPELKQCAKSHYESLAQ